MLQTLHYRVAAPPALRERVLQSGWKDLAQLPWIGAPAQHHEQALLLAARVRLRPILMTTLAMIFGMVPLAFALSEGSEQRAPMGQSVIGGVVTSSLLTLVVVPVVYCYLDDFSQWLRRLWNGNQHDAAPGQGAASAPTLPRDS